MGCIVARREGSQTWPGKPALMSDDRAIADDPLLERVARTYATAIDWI
jgi:hypothetical protein